MTLFAISVRSGPEHSGSSVADLASLRGVGDVGVAALRARAWQHDAAA